MPFNYYESAFHAVKPEDEANAIVAELDMAIAEESLKNCNECQCLKEDGTYLNECSDCPR